MASSDKEKWIISVWSAAVFALIASPFMYKLTQAATGAVGFSTSNEGCPNYWGLLLHSVVFLLIVRGMMAIKLPGVN